MPEARPAATIVVLRARPEGLQTLMVKRSGRAGFFPDTWVFPGGRVDPADARVGTRGLIDGLDSSDSAFAVAAIRECYEEAGVWLGDGEPPEGFRDALNQRAATLLDAPTLVANLDRLFFIAWWITPEAEPRRYDTRFFLTVLDDAEGQDASHDNREVVSSLWLAPGEAVRRHLAGEDFFLAPPTLQTLRTLSPCRSAQEAIAAFEPPRPLTPRLEIDDEGGIHIILPGDASWPSADPVKGATRLVLRDGIWESRGG